MQAPLSLCLRSALPKVMFVQDLIENKQKLRFQQLAKMPRVSIIM